METTNEQRWADDSPSNRAHVLEGCGATIDDAQRLAAQAWESLPRVWRIAIAAHGYEHLCNYGYNE